MKMFYFYFKYILFYSLLYTMLAKLCMSSSLQRLWLTKTSTNEWRHLCLSVCTFILYVAVHTHFICLFVSNNILFFTFLFACGNKMCHVCKLWMCNINNNKCVFSYKNTMSQWSTHFIESYSLKGEFLSLMTCMQGSSKNARSFFSQWKNLV